MDRFGKRYDSIKPSTSSKYNTTGRINEARADFPKSRTVVRPQSVEPKPKFQSRRADNASEVNRGNSKIPIAIGTRNCSAHRPMARRQTPSPAQRTYTVDVHGTSTRNISAPRPTARRQTPSPAQRTYTVEVHGTSKKNKSHQSRMDSKTDLSAILKAKRSATFIIESTLPIEKSSKRSAGGRSLSVPSEVSSLAGAGAGASDAQILSELERTKKLEVFGNLQLKLHDIQTEFIREIKNLEQTNTELEHDFKFVTIVKINNFKLIFKEDHLQKMIQEFPTDLVNELKKTFCKTIENCLMCFRDNPAMAQKSPHNEQLLDKLRDYKIKSFLALDDFVYVLMCARDMETSKPIERLTEINKILNSLEKEKDTLETKLKQAADAELITKELTGFKQSLLILSKKLTGAEIQLSRQKKKNNELSAKLEITEAELKKAKKELEEFYSKQASCSTATDAEKSLYDEMHILRNCLEVEKLDPQMKINKLEKESDCAEENLHEAGSELIDSLEENDRRLRYHLAKSFAELSEKDDIGKEFSHQPLVMSERVRNISSIYASAHLQLSHPEQIIKILEDRDNLNKKLRAVLGGKIAHKAKEIAKMKEETDVSKDEYI